MPGRSVSEAPQATWGASQAYPMPSLPRSPPRVRPGPELCAREHAAHGLSQTHKNKHQAGRLHACTRAQPQLTDTRDLATEAPQPSCWAAQARPRARNCPAHHTRTISPIHRTRTRHLGRNLFISTHTRCSPDVCVAGTVSCCRERERSRCGVPFPQRTAAAVPAGMCTTARTVSDPVQYHRVPPALLSQTRQALAVCLINDGVCDATAGGAPPPLWPL